MAGFYERRLFNPLMDLALRQPRFHGLREHLLADLADSPLEIGPGTGLNFPHYPPRVRSVRVVAREPELDPRALERARQRGITVEHIVASADPLPFADESEQDLVCTFVLCSVSDPDAKLAEFNPPDNLAGLATAKVPLFAVHGDNDALVPYDDNTKFVKQNYEAAGGTFELKLIPGGRHEVTPAFFECQELIDFVLKQSK